MANENIPKTLNTRIALKYDSLANWEKSSLVLKAGEVAIAYIEKDETGKVINSPIKDLNGNVTDYTAAHLPPAMAMKVGDGSHTFANLPWVQAVAGDVYAWAKSSKAPTIAELTDGVTDITELVNGIIENTEGIHDTNTTYKVEQVKDTNGKHIIKLRAYLNGVAQPDTDTLTIDLSDIDTLTDPLNHIEYGKNQTKVDANNKLMAKTAVQNVVDSAIGAIPVQPAEDDDSSAVFISKIENEEGKLTYKRTKITKDHIDGTLDQDQVAGLSEIKTNADNAVTLLGHTDYGTKDAIGADNKLMTSTAVQEVVDTAIETLDAKISVEQDEVNNNPYVTGVTRDAETGAIVVTRDTLNHDKIGDWTEEVTNKLALKADAADLHYSDDTKPSATNYIVRRNDIEGLAHGLHYRGIVESDPTEWADPTDNPDTVDADEEYIAGDIVIREFTVVEIVDNEEKEYVTTLEYIFDGTEWQELGSEGFHATKAELDSVIAKVNTLEAKHDKDKEDIDKAIEEAIGTAGNNAAGAIEAALDKLDTPVRPENSGKFAISVTQIDGQVAVEYANLDAADIPDEMSTGKIAGLQAHMDATKAHFNAAVGASGQANGLVEGNPLTTKAYVDSVAASAAEAAVNGLNAAKKDDDKKFATIVNQVNGEIEVTYDGIAIADLPENIPTTKLADNAKITAVLNNIDGGAATEVLKDNNKLATTNTVSAAVEAGVAALDSELHAIAKSGNVNDLVQTSGEVLFFNCGSSTTVI